MPRLRFANEVARATLMIAVKHRFRALVLGCFGLGYFIRFEQVS